MCWALPAASTGVKEPLDLVTKRLGGVVGEWVGGKGRRWKSQLSSEGAGEGRTVRRGPGSRGRVLEGRAWGTGSGGALVLQALFGASGCWRGGGEAVRLAAEEREGLIGGLASRGGGRDLITTIITIICLELNSSRALSAPVLIGSLKGPAGMDWGGLGEACPSSWGVEVRAGRSHREAGRNWGSWEGRWGARAPEVSHIKSHSKAWSRASRGPPGRGGWSGAV